MAAVSQFRAAFLGLLLLPGVGAACPSINGLEDINCDGVIKIAVLGDSITVGEQDDHPFGGYPRRLKESHFRRARVVRVNKSGATSLNFFQFVRDSIPNRRKIRNADYSIILIGINDFFVERPPSEIEDNIKLLQKLLKRIGVQKRLVGFLLPLRGKDEQQLYATEVNADLANFAQIHFDYINSATEISSDGIHPNAIGYDTMAEIAADALRAASEEAQQTQRDTDGDGIPNFYEKYRFFTDPENPDTDNDSIDDCREFFNRACR